MAGYLVLLCNVERIPSLDLVPGGVRTHFGFGMNLMAGWSSDSPDIPPGLRDASLKLWEWNRIDEIRYHWRDGSDNVLVDSTTGAAIIRSVPLIAQTGVPSPADLSPFRQQMDAAYLDSKTKSISNLVWLPPSTATFKITDAVLIDLRNKGVVEDVLAALRATLRNVEFSNVATFLDAVRVAIGDQTLFVRYRDSIQGSSQQGGKIIEAYRLGGNQKPWHVTLGHVSTYPFPLPQAFNLSHLFRVPVSVDEQTGVKLFAAPLLKQADGFSFPPEDRMPLGTSEKDPLDDRVYFWRYNTRTFDVRAYLAPSPRSVDPDELVSLEDLWVRGVTDFHSDWQSKLEVGLSEGFQLPYALLELMRATENHTLLTTENSLELCVNYFLASLRDVAGLGLTQSPDGSRLALRLFDRAADKPDISEQFLEQLQTASAKLFTDQLIWRYFLRETLTGAKALSVLKVSFAINDGALDRAGVPEAVRTKLKDMKSKFDEEQPFLEAVKALLTPPEFSRYKLVILKSSITAQLIRETPRHIVAELEKLMELALGSRANAGLWMILREQWKQLLDTIPGNDSVKIKILKALDEAARKNEIDLRQQLALSNLGIFWTAFIGSNIDTTDPKGRSLVDKCLPAFLRYYARARFSLGPKLPGDPPDDGCQVPDLAPGFNPDVGPQTVQRALRDAIIRQVTTWADNLKPRLLPGLGAAEDQIHATDTPHAITLQVGKMKPAPEESFDDVLKKLSGLGVLMREGASDWRLLNMGFAFSGDQRLNLSRPVLAPSRINYRSDLRQICVSYNNQPLISDSPLSQRGIAKVEMYGASLRLTSTSIDNLRGQGVPPQVLDKLNVPTILNLEFIGEQFFIEKIKQAIANDTLFETHKAAILREALRQSSDAIPSVDTLVQYRYRPSIDGADSLDDLVRIPGLKYGKSYKFAIFGITSAGAIPRKLADPADPNAPCRIYPASLAATDTVPGDVSKEVLYQRRVRVGAMRLLDARDAQKPLQLPVIPRNVFPRARDIPMTLPGSVEDQNHELPLLMLYKKGDVLDAFEFDVKRPATGWECWDRWTAGDGTTEDGRIKVLADFYRQAATNREREKLGLQQTDIQLDDPALEQKLYFELEEEVDGLFQLRKSLPVVVENAPGPDIKLAQCPAVRVQVSFSEDTQDLKPGGAPGTVVVQVKKGTVYKLNISACLKPEINPARFFPGIVSPRPVGDLRLVSPSYLFIEAATDEMPTSQQLFEACVPHVGLVGDQWKLSLQLDADPRNNLFRNLSRAEVRRQVWRWQGRETFLHPELNPSMQSAGAAQALIDATRNWEAREFGDRPESDNVVHDMASLRYVDAAPDKLKNGGYRRFRYEELLGELQQPTSATGGPALQFREAKTRSEERGLHFRFAVKAFSRYGGIFPPNKLPYVEAFEEIDYDQGAGDRKVTNYWKHKFVPCRYVGPVPPPKVKLILPLTESFERNPSRSPGLLVVLNEPWHEIGGLGEELKARVITSPEPGAGPRKFYFEMGPDPVITNDPAKRLRDTTRGAVSFGPGIRGPVGHYFDRDNTSALFVGTSFVLPAPDLPVDKAKDVSWFLAKLQLRREITIGNPPAADIHREYEPGTWEFRKVTSEYTDPFWVQYLPEFSIFDVDRETMKPSELRVWIDDAGLQIKNKETSAVTLLKAYASVSGIFSLYLVLTQMVTDVTGQVDQEHYVGLYKPQADRWLPYDTDEAVTASAAGLRFRARIIEVQRPTDLPVCAATAGNLWEELFGTPQNPECDVRSRIVRISEPIEDRNFKDIDCDELTK